MTHDREEYIEQAYFFRALRERLADKQPAQEVLGRLHEEVLSTTRLPMAIEYLASELKFSGILHPAMARLEHYFSPFQTFVISQAENDRSRFDLSTGLLILERLADYFAGEPTRAGAFVFQFESISRNRLGYDEGLQAISRDSYFDDGWQRWVRQVRTAVGTVDFTDLLYSRSEYYVQQRRRHAGDDESKKRPVLFGEKEGKIAWANRGKDPLYLFAALQRQLGYPVVPRPPRPDESVNLLQELQRKVQSLEKRIQILEGELKGEMDLSKYYVKPDEEEAGDVPHP